MSCKYFSAYLSFFQVLVCVEHEHERMQFYCRSCQRLLCALCKMRRVHNGHKVMPIAHAYQTLKVLETLSAFYGYTCHRDMQWELAHLLIIPAVSQSFLRWQQHVVWNRRDTGQEFHLTCMFRTAQENKMRS